MGLFVKNKKDENFEIKKNILEEIKKNDSIIILRHYRPDGDAIGSAFGLKYILEDSFPTKNIYCVGDGIPEYLSFIGSEDVVDENIIKSSLIIVVDTATSDRIATNTFNINQNVIKIDHHIVTENYGYLNLIYEDAPACCQIIYEFADTFKDILHINEKAALALYTGLVTDTGRFKYSSVTESTFNCAGKLISHNINTDLLYSYLNNKNPESFKLQGYVYEHFNITANGVAYIYISKKKIKKFKTTANDAANLVNCLDSIKGSLIWLLFIEYDNEIRIRFRSRYIPVVDIAVMFGGGGHENAAGGKILKRKDYKQVLKVADEKLQAFKLSHKDLF